MRTSRLFMLVTAAFLMLGAFIYTNAQQLDTTCPILIDQALNAIGTNCSSLDRNSACYGYQQVDATFTEPTGSEFFTQPSDRAGLTTLKRIGTSPLDLAQAKWGIALLSLQANLPDSLPGQNTVFMLLGDTEVENAVKPEDIVTNPARLAVTMLAETQLFDFPEESEQGIATIPAQTALTADGISADGAFVRVAFGELAGWITRATLDPAVDLSAMSVINPRAQSPMQTFYLRTNITGTNCTQAPDSLVVQGPEEFKVDINVNGADIRLGSTIALRILSLSPDLAELFRSVYPGIDQVTRIMEVVVIDGHVTLDPGTDHEIGLDEGYRTYRCLSETENLGLDEVQNDRHVFPACPWLQPDRWRQTDYDNYNVLEGVPLNYTITLPEFPAPTLTPSNTPTRRPTLRPPTRTPSPTPTCTVPILEESVDSLAADPVPCTLTPTSTSTNTPTPTSTLTPSNTPTLTPSNTLTPTLTPSNTPTNTLTPSNTPTLTPSNTPTDTPTNTLVPPTATWTDTATNTLVPPTATWTDTATNTLPPPTATWTDTATNTLVPPTATDTPLPTATDTPLPTATDTPVPIP